jgi:hypothetical protein
LPPERLVWGLPGSPPRRLRQHRGSGPARSARARTADRRCPAGGGLHPGANAAPTPPKTPRTGGSAIAHPAVRRVNHRLDPRRPGDRRDRRLPPRRPCSNSAARRR